MITFEGVNYIDKYISDKNEYIQAYIQGYEFTIIEHVYEKNNKNYKYNNKTLEFDEIILDIKCRRYDDEINYPELSDEEAFDKIFKEMELFNTFSKYNYGQKYYPESDPKYAWSKGYFPK